MSTHTEESDTSLVINCPQCHRTIWAGTRCYHGVPPDVQSKEAPKEQRSKYRSGGLKRSSMDEPFGPEVDE